MFIPVFFASINHLLQGVDKHLVEALIKAVSLWMVSTRDALLNICHPKETGVDFIHKFTPLIRLNNVWPSMLTESVKQKLGNTFSTFRLQWCYLRPLGEVV